MSLYRRLETGDSVMVNNTGLEQHGKKGKIIRVGRNNWIDVLLDSPPTHFIISIEAMDLILLSQSRIGDAPDDCVTDDHGTSFVNQGGEDNARWRRKEIKMSLHKECINDLKLWMFGRPITRIPLAKLDDNDHGITVTEEHTITITISAGTTPINVTLTHEEANSLCNELMRILY
jgi:hypothetical protein